MHFHRGLHHPARPDDDPAVPQLTGSLLEFKMQRNQRKRINFFII
jgi:hypothetical protein